MAPKVTVSFDPKKLLPVLNNTGLQQTDNPLYQFLFQLLNQLGVLTVIANSSSGGGGSSTIINNITKKQYIIKQGSNGNSESNRTIIIRQGSNATPSLDYVVMSDGAAPIPNPVNDGFGNFIYIPYNP